MSAQALIVRQAAPHGFADEGVKEAVGPIGWTPQEVVRDQPGGFGVKLVFVGEAGSEDPLEVERAIEDGGQFEHVSTGGGETVYPLSDEPLDALWEFPADATIVPLISLSTKDAPFFEGTHGFDRAKRIPSGDVEDF